MYTVYVLVFPYYILATLFEPNERYSWNLALLTSYFINVAAVRTSEMEATLTLFGITTYILCCVYLQTVFIF